MNYKYELIYQVQGLSIPSVEGEVILLEQKRNDFQIRLADTLKTIATSKEIVSFSTAHVAFIYLSDAKENVFKLNLDLFRKWNDQFNLRILSA